MAIFTVNYSGNTGNYYEFKAEAWESDVDVQNNTSKVNVEIYIRRNKLSSDSAWNNNGSEWSITIDGSYNSGVSKWDTRNSTNWIWLGYASKIVNHNADGSGAVAISATHTGNTSSGMGSASGSAVFTLATIPRYTTVWVSERGKTVNSISVNWTTADARDYTQYSLNGGAWQDAYDTVDSINKNGYYTIGGLFPNTSYTVKTRCRRADSGLWSESSVLTITTYDIAKISNLPDFEHADDCIVNVTNPGNISNLELIMKINDTQILSRSVSAGDNTISFSDTELDDLYKEYGSNNSLDATFILSGSGYTDSKTCTVTLKGNQKTVQTNINNNWTRGKLWINVEGIWKKAVLWANVNGTWKRGI